MTATTDEPPETSPPADLYVYAGRVGNFMVAGDGRAIASMQDGTSRMCRLVAVHHDPDTNRHALLVSEGDLTP